MFHFRFVAVMALVLFTGSCFAQAGLALINDDGKIVGWLLAKNAGQHSSQYMTPDGYIMSVNSGGYVETTGNIIVTELLYQSADCSGQAYIKTEFLSSEIVHLGSDRTNPVFARTDHSGTNFVKSMQSNKTPQGVCVPWGIPDDRNVIRTTEIDPLDYGIKESVSGLWRVHISRREVQRPEIISCSGFEGCPTP